MRSRWEALEREKAVCATLAQFLASLRLAARAGRSSAMWWALTTTSRPG